MMLNDKSQDSTAKHLSFDELLHCKFITQFAGERISKIGEQFGEVIGKMVDRVTHPIRPCCRIWHGPIRLCR